MERGDRVKFTGPINDYLVSVQQVLRRTGEIISMPGDTRHRDGKVGVRWIPKTKRGQTEYFRHHIEHLEVVGNSEA